MKVDCMILESSFRSWESLCDEASAFATRVGRERLINISVSAAGEHVGAKGTIIVWYWNDGSISNPTEEQPEES